MNEKIHWDFDIVSEEDEYWFLDQRFDADLSEWSRKYFWTSDEAAALTFGRSPLEITRLYVESVLADDSEFVSRFIRLHDLINKAQQSGVLPNVIRPGLFVDWAFNNNVVLPPDLISSIRDADRPLESLRNEIERLNKEISEAKREIDRLNGLLALSGRAPEPELSTRPSSEEKSKSTLLKLLYVMAREKYHFDPARGRQSAPTNISNACERLGLSVSDDTVRKWLQAAREEFGGTPQKSVNPNPV